MPTILSVNNYYYPRGGAETLFFEHNHCFESIGWKVIPFSMQHPNNFESEWGNYFVEEIELGSEYSFIEKIIRAQKIIYSLEARSKVENLINKNKIDICHAHNIYHHISPSILGVISEKQIPIVMTLHDLKILCPAYNMLARDGICERCKRNKVYNVLINKCIKNSISLSALVMVEAIFHRSLNIYAKYVDKFVVPSKFYIQKFLEWGWSESQLIHIPNFIAIDRYQPNYFPGKAFVYFGRLSKEKGLLTLIKAAASAKVLLRVVGSGPDEAAIRKVSEDLNGNVEFLGYLRGEDLHNVIRSARAVVLPSEWYENAPMSIIEAYALGKPVIGADIGGIPELINAGETGITFESGSIEQLASVLSEISEMPRSRVEEMGHMGRKLAEARFGRSLYEEKMKCLYKNLGVG